MPVTHTQGLDFLIMTLFGKDFVRSLVLGFALGSAVMASTFGAEQAQAATAPTALSTIQIVTGR
jgi:hypothetical protein